MIYLRGGSRFFVTPFAVIAGAFDSAIPSAFHPFLTIDLLPHVPLHSLQAQPCNNKTRRKIHLTLHFPLF